MRYNQQLLRAARKGKVDQILYCLNKEADIEAKNSYGETAFMLAGRSRNVEAVRLLLNRGLRCK